jgi:hypothetical protein
MNTNQKTIIFIILCSLIGAILHLWIGIESYPNLNKPTNYLSYILIGLFLGYTISILGILLKINWKE